MSSPALVPRSADTQVQLSAVLPGRHPGEGPMTGNRGREPDDVSRGRVSVPGLNHRDCSGGGGWPRSALPTGSPATPAVGPAGPTAASETRLASWLWSVMWWMTAVSARSAGWRREDADLGEEVGHVEVLGGVHDQPVADLADAGADDAEAAPGGRQAGNVTGVDSGHHPFRGVPGAVA